MHIYMYWTPFHRFTSVMTLIAYQFIAKSDNNVDHCLLVPFPYIISAIFR